MGAIIAASFSRARTTLLLLGLLFVAGVYSYITMPKEAQPEVEVPFFAVSVAYPGISAEDSARLLVEPLERRLHGLDGLRRLSGDAGEGFATIRLEFTAGSDNATARQAIRDQLDAARNDLPSGAEAPVLRELDVSLFPILTVALYGTVPERDLIEIARRLGNDIESVPGVLEANLSGDRDDLVEVLIDPLAMQSFGISPQEVAQAVQRNNRLVAAGALDTGSGRIGISVPGTVRAIADVLEIPVRAVGRTVVRIADVAEVRQTFRDPVSFARINGRPAIAIDITRSSGANVLTTVAAVKELVSREKAAMPDAVSIDYLQNQAEDISSLLGDLENSVILAVLLVMLPTILVLGLRASLLVGIAIPSSFFAAILVINLLGFTLNMVVLFGLILVIGMLVDGAMVVVELAERHQEQGMGASSAFIQASQRVAWPVIVSVATSLAAFFPLLFWPGIAGRFMFFLPATVMIALAASLFMALIFIPVIGGLLGSRGSRSAPDAAPVHAPRFYGRLLDVTIAKPGLTLGVGLLVLLASLMLYSRLGGGVSFFPAIEPERAQIQITADGDLSVYEADVLVRLVESRVVGFAGVERTYARTIGSIEQRLRANLSPDVIGTIQLDFADWRTRSPAATILEGLRRATEDIPGVGLTVEEQQGGPGDARPVEIEVAAPDSRAIPAAVRLVKELLERQGTFTDIATDAPTPGLEVQLHVNRALAGRYGVSIDEVGQGVRLITNNGLILGSYLPQGAQEDVDIALRFPTADRTFAQLGGLRVASGVGNVPVANFVTFAVGQASHVVNRRNGENVQTITAGLIPGATVAQELQTFRQVLDETRFEPGVTVRFAGEIQDMQETLQFLLVAFVLAISLMFMIMLLQLNSFFQSFLVLAAILCSLPGVFLMLAIRQDAFSLVMGGMGIMALAGVIVNNNIILIDAYNEHRAAGLDPNDAARRAAAGRFRPILLTAFTTITGLMPMVLGLTVDFFGRDAYFGAPSALFWMELSMTVVTGLAFGTVVTSCLTPSLLAWDGRRRSASAPSAS